MPFKTYGLTDRSYNELMMILASFPEIEEVIIYGSRAKGDFYTHLYSCIKNPRFKENVDHEDKVLYSRN